MPTTRQCAECGTRLPDDVPEGACPVCSLRAALATRDVPSKAAVTEKPGERIGRYKLLEKIGEGGYGVVYMAEQSEPIRRRVALKIVKLGMDTKQVVARFEAERQALALMDHPSIAKVLDAGATASGRPYFVMELVRGIKITDYCDRHSLPTRQRLDLLMQICHAVQHAHQKGIIHRDLKPSNVLVTELDGRPVPKVIDFGLAKATGQQFLTDKTLFTAFRQFIGTPAYMSPEQTELSGADVDTRSDIYSLGVLLYELLTGHLPFELKELRQAGFDEMRRLIQEQEPVKPSTRLSSLSADDLTTVARHRQSESPRLVHLVRGDLDWIVMKCLEKDRARRYETAIGLAQDVERHLNSEPITAGAPGAAYRISKFIRRHRYGFATASALLLLLISGAVVSLWLMMRFRSAEHQASAAVRLLDDIVGSAAVLGQDPAELEKILDDDEKRIARDFDRQSALVARLNYIFGTVYEALGKYEKAETALRQSLAIRRKLFSNEEVANSLNNLAAVVKGQGRLKESEGSLREAVEIWKKVSGSSSTNLARSLDSLGMVLLLEHKLDEAEQVLREALDMQIQLAGEDDLTTATFIGNLGVVLKDQGRLDEAENLHRRALEIQRKLLGNENPKIATSLNNLGEVLQKQDKLDDAAETFREVVRMRRNILGSEHPNTALSLNNLATVLQQQNKLDEAADLERQALAIYRKRLKGDHPYIVASLLNLAYILKLQNKTAEAEARYREALAIQHQSLDKAPDPSQKLAGLTNRPPATNSAGKAVAR